MKHVIQTTDLTKTYVTGVEKIHALRQVSLSIAEGEFTTIVGPSGSGKTTLLNMIGGLDKPTSGNIIIGDTDISDFSENKMIDFRLHHIGFVFQAYNLIPVLTALENVSLIMLLQHRPKDEIDERARQILEQVGLADKMNKRPTELSGGQQQRVAVARALASHPKYVLADEPTANLDSASAIGLLDIMAKLNEEEGTTFIFSTHDQRVVDRARRVLTLVDGAISEDENR